MTFIKHGDLQPINNIDPVDVDDDSTRKSLDKLKENLNESTNDQKVLAETKE